MIESLINFVSALILTNSSNGVSPPPESVYLGFRTSVWALSVGGAAALCAVLWSLHTVNSHYKLNKNEQVRYHILRVLGMVPVYSLTAWLGLYWVHQNFYFKLIQEVYESVTIYSFMAFIIAYLNGSEKVSALLATKIQVSHPSPVSYVLADWKMGEEFYNKTYYGVFQYVITRFVLAILAFLLAETEVYCEGNFSLSCGYPYCAFLNNLSQIIAMYCLVLFIYALLDDLQEIRIILKLLCIKAVVFFTFWQSIAIAILVYAHFIHETQKYTTEDSAANSVQNFLICIEMLIAAYSHAILFPATEFQANSLIIRVAETPSINSALENFQPDEINSTNGASNTASRGKLVQKAFDNMQSKLNENIESTSTD